MGSGEQEDDMPVQSNYSSYSNLSVTHTGSAVALPVSFTFSNLAINTNHSNQIEEEVGEDEEDEDDNSSTGNRPKSSESAYTNEDGTAPVTPRLGRFSMRKAQEDALLQEKLAAHAATRMKDVLEEKISELETQLHSEKNGRKQDYKHFQVAKESLQLEQRVLAAEVSRLTQKVSGCIKCLQFDRLLILLTFLFADYG
ncbi:hypothetical protein EON65_27365 [archaeon]|nr:MAG: hypothetical protein EON65_27365 [archaeon]